MAADSQKKAPKTDDLGTQIPNRYLEMYRRAMSGRSRSSAIRCFCVQCMGWQASEVSECTATRCPLFAYRNGKAEGE